MQDYPLNPKALSLGELYGEFDLNTNEWTDGVLSSVMRQTCAGTSHFKLLLNDILAQGHFLKYEELKVPEDNTNDFCE